MGRHKTETRKGIIRLSTGVLDTKGNEVFEGDTIKYRNKSFTVRWCCEGLRFMLSSFHGDPIPVNKGMLQESEVVV